MRALYGKPLVISDDSVVPQVSVALCEEGHGAPVDCRRPHGFLIPRAKTAQVAAIATVDFASYRCAKESAAVRSLAITMLHHCREDVARARPAAVSVQNRLNVHSCISWKLKAAW